MDNADISSTVLQRQTRTHKETIDYSTDINHWKGSTVKEEDILCQLHLRGAGLTEEQEQQYSNTKKKGKGTKETGRTYLVGLVEKRINSGRWTTKVNDELLRKRIEDWRGIKRKKVKQQRMNFHKLSILIYIMNINLKHEFRKRPISDEMLIKQTTTSKMKTTDILKKYKKHMLLDNFDFDKMELYNEEDI